ncbi:MAG: amidohydrolase [Clostridia bacterium]|nr:amidohydrolase [Clostridia bacterium]
MEFEIIDFHAHPYESEKNCICIHPTAIKRSANEFIKDMDRCGVNLCCGSVVSLDKKPENLSWWEHIKPLNDEALEIKKLYGDRIFPGVTIHPESVETSIEEIDRFLANGINLIGELVWYVQGYNTYCSKNMQTILDYASEKGMVLSVHPTDYDDMDKLCENHPNLIIVGAHPSENEAFIRHVERAKKYKNYYIDLSGGGIYRYGMTRRLVNEIGAEKILFGSDYPICNLQMYVDGVRNDNLLTKEEKRLILSDNAKRILKI